VTDILQKIMNYKKGELEHYKRLVPFAELRDRVRDLPPTHCFAKALKNPTAPYAVIAEMKKKSPSKGVLRENYDPAAIAVDYESHGATALSVLTDEHFFAGHLDHLRAVRPRVKLPLLRKDFLWDPYQVYAAREAGADAVLLIVSVLEKSRLEDLHALAVELAMDVLVEIHDMTECDLACAGMFPIIGVNNRDLKTFEVDLKTSERLFARLGRDTLKISESGLDSRESLEKLKQAGAHGFLIGEALMKAAKPGEALEKLIYG
jgi:indole-3-glycerol phosphate synthase